MECNTLRARWDKKKSPVDNLASMGLDADPNVLVKTNKATDAFVGFIDLPSVDSKELDKNPKRKKISDADIEYGKACMLKYGKDYKAMERDIKTNYNQLSQNQMRKLCDKILVHEQGE